MAASVLDDLETFGPESCRSLSYGEAAAYTRRLARTHYENFTVLSRLVPRDLAKTERKGRRAGAEASGMEASRPVSNPSPKSVG